MRFRSSLECLDAPNAITPLNHRRHRRGGRKSFRNPNDRRDIEHGSLRRNEQPVVIPDIDSNNVPVTINISSGRTRMSIHNAGYVTCDSDSDSEEDYRNEDDAEVEPTLRAAIPVGRQAPQRERSSQTPTDFPIRSSVRVVDTHSKHGDRVGMVVRHTAAYVVIALQKDGREVRIAPKFLCRNANPRSENLPSELLERTKDESENALTRPPHIIEDEPDKKSPREDKSLDAWKCKRTHFEKRSSCVGPEFQVDLLPAAESYISKESASCDGNALFEQVWDSKEAEKSGKLVEEAWKEVAEAKRNEAAARNKARILEAEAVAAARQVAYLEDRLKCPMCHDLKEKMHHVISCGHTICFECLWVWGRKCWCGTKAKKESKMYKRIYR